MTAKTLYTYAELSKMNTQRLIATFNRIFNINAYELFFNPFEHRTDMLLQLMDEMRLQKALSLLPAVDGPVEKYQAMKIVISPEGFSVLWNVGVSEGNRKVSDEQMALIRELREDGETYKQIAQFVGVPQITVFRVLTGEYATQANRWNTEADAPEQIKVRPAKKATFKAATRKANYETVASMDRPANDFWMGLGL